MKAAEWIDLIQRFPPAEFDGFGLYMTSGLEITLQTVLQLNADHMLIRGRTVGSTDAGRFFYVPYDHIVCIVFNRPKKEEEVLSWYDGQPPAVISMPETTAAEPESEEAPAARPAPVRPAPAQPIRPAAAPAVAQASAGLQSSNNPIKTALLERLRARRQGQDPAAPEKK
jgi:hypothetical protein